MSRLICFVYSKEPLSSTQNIFFVDKRKNQFLIIHLSIGGDYVERIHNRKEQIFFMKELRNTRQKSGQFNHKKTVSRYDCGQPCEPSIT